MSKKFFAALTMASAFMLTGAMVAEAADVNFGGQIRLRGEAWSNFNNQNWNSYIGNRVRLNANVKVSDDLSAFIQLQSSTRFGSSDGSSGSHPAAANDIDSDVGVHQAYFIQKDLFGAVDIKAGRQEIVLDGHRLFGHTGWTTGAQSHDAIKLSHSHGNMTVALFYSKVFEDAKQKDGGKWGGDSADDNNDRTVWNLWANWKGLIGAKSSTSAYLVYDDNNTGVAATGTVLNKDYTTFGLRQAGAAGGLDYRVEGYYQLGKSGVADSTGASGDRSAYMVGARIGKTFSNVTMKPKITLWADLLSGTDPTDAGAGVGKYNSFTTLFDTGHKFYGFMDKFLGMGSKNTGRNGRGLIDLAVKLAMQPAAKTTVKLDYHLFQSTEDASATNDASTLGTELDITVVHKYNSNLNIVAGYSRFFARNLFFVDDPGFIGFNTDSSNYEDQQWAYLMLDMKF